MLGRTSVDAQIFLAQIFGFRVDRATAALPQTASTPIFTVSGGPVLVVACIGEVTTIIQAQANAVKLIATPTVGSAVDLCTTVDINALEVGGKLSLPGPVGSALTKTNAGASVLQAQANVVAVGTINLNTAASSTGAIKWSIFYLPLDDNNGVVTAA